MAAETEEDAFLLQRDHASSVREYLQHQLISRDLFQGHHLHSSCCLNDGAWQKKRVLRIADVAAGTGAWAADVARTLEADVTVDAFDISPARFPPEKIRPPNVNFHTHNAWDPFPAELHGTYDVVHIRFLVAAVTDQNVSRLIENVTQLLAPGGYLHWLDVEHKSARAVPVDEDTPPTMLAANQLATLMQISSGTDSANWLVVLEEVCKEKQLSVVHSQHWLPPPMAQFVWQQIYHVTAQEIFRNIEANGADTQMIEATREMSRIIALEFTAGVMLSVDFFLIVAQKPA